VPPFAVNVVLVPLQIVELVADTEVGADELVLIVNEAELEFTSQLEEVPKTTHR
jgi:hypothetical protein